MHAGGAEVAAGAERDVVEHHRHRAGVGHRLEVGDDPGLRRPHVIRHDDQRRRRAPGVPASASHRRDGGRGVVRAGADDQLRGALGADRGARVDDRALLLGVERAGFAGGAQRDDAGGAGVEVLVAEQRRPRRARPSRRPRTE